MELLLLLQMLGIKGLYTKFYKVRRREKQRYRLQNVLIIITILLTVDSTRETQGCEFLVANKGEYSHFLRVPENTTIGETVANFKVKNKGTIKLVPTAKTDDDASYFTFNDFDQTAVSIHLARSLEDLVDGPDPKSILKLRIECVPDNNHAVENQNSAFLVLHVYIEDINDHAPEFVNAPYFVTVEEVTPVGLPLFSGIEAYDNDKPNSANSDVYYSILNGNEKGNFKFQSNDRPILILQRKLDFDDGDTMFELLIQASDRGTPAKTSTQTLTVQVIDNDDLPPVFSHSSYRAMVEEFFPYTNKRIRRAIKTDNAISAYDQDVKINATIGYKITSGNDLGYFEISEKTGTVYLVKEIDRESLESGKFFLGLQAWQLNDRTKIATSRLEIGIIDLNDNRPRFEVESYNISIMENLPNGFSVLEIAAIDADEGLNADFTYKIDDPSGAFEIDENSGWLTVRNESVLDREKIPSLNLKVIAHEEVPNIAYGNNYSTATVEIHLLDSNDGTPVFMPSNIYNFQVTIDSEIGSVVGQVHAKDPDVGTNGDIIYEIQSPSMQTDEINEEDLKVPFSLDHESGYIFVLERPLQKLQYTLLVQAKDLPVNPSEARYSLAVVQIQVVKAGPDYSPKFLGAPYEFWVGRRLRIGTSVGRIKVEGLESKYTVFDLLHEYEHGVPFAIEERTGIIAVVDNLDNYKRSAYDFEAYVSDSRHTLTSNVTIHIVDPLAQPKDMDPKSSLRLDLNNDTLFELSVPENRAGMVVGNLKKLLVNSKKINVERYKDFDSFVLANNKARDAFGVSDQGSVYTLKELDREKQKRYLLTIIGQSSRTGFQGVYSFIVHIEDENDNPPKFSSDKYIGQIQENSPPGTIVDLSDPIKTFDLDEGRNAKYNLTLVGPDARKFLIDGEKGRLVLGNYALDREKSSHYVLKIVANDTGGLHSEAEVIIKILDVNDNAPQFSKKVVLDSINWEENNNGRDYLRSSASSRAQVEITPSEPIVVAHNVKIGTRIARVLAVDKDEGENSEVYYRIVTESMEKNSPKKNFFDQLNSPNKSRAYLLTRRAPKFFTIDRKSGEIRVAKALQPNSLYSLNISAADKGGLRSFADLTIMVKENRNFEPAFKSPWYTFEIEEGMYLRGEVGQVRALLGEAKLNELVRYSILSNASRNGQFPFRVNQNTGHVLVEGQLDREKKSLYKFKILARNKELPKLSAVVDVEVNIIDVNDNAPTFYDYRKKMVTKSGVIPVYETEVSYKTKPGSLVFQVKARDLDSSSNGNGLILFQTGNHHEAFRIDSKTGSLYTTGILWRNNFDQYNVTVVASDLGRPSLRSICIVLIRPKEKHLSNTKSYNDSASRSLNLATDDVFPNNNYTFLVPKKATLPYFITKLNLTEPYKDQKMIFELQGSESIVSNFRLGQKSGELYIIRQLAEGKPYEMTIIAKNRDFARRQNILKNMNRKFGKNEIKVHVQMLPIKQHAPSYMESSTTFRIPNTSSKPKSGEADFFPNLEEDFSGTSNTMIEDISEDSDEVIEKSLSSYYGQVAVLILSCIIFLGGLVAAISVACMQKKRRLMSTRRRHQEVNHYPHVPVEVRLQKQMYIPGRIANGPSRPVIFPVALPNAMCAAGSTEQIISSDGISSCCGEDFSILEKASSRNLRRKDHKSKKPEITCPECRRIRLQSVKKQSMIGNRKKNFKGSRGNLFLGNEDSGVDDVCRCCAMNSSRESSDRDVYDDSLMPPVHTSKGTRVLDQRRSDRDKGTRHSKKYRIGSDKSIIL